MWEIIDNNGTIHSGTEWEMKKAFYVMTHEKHEIIDNYEISDYDAGKLIDEYETDWDGDLKLIEVHDISK